jgi:hypothetical protein
MSTPMATKIEVWLDEDRQVIRQKVVGNLVAEDFKCLDEQTVKVAQRLRDPERVRILFDARESKKASYQARREAIETLRRPTLYRMAGFGATPVGRMMMRFVVMVAGVKHVRMFERETEALEWLLS